MFHKTIATDNGIDCYRCGTSVDFPWMPISEESSAISSPWENDQMEEEIRFLLPDCPGITENHGHHWFALGADKDDSEHLIGAIECHRCSAYVGWGTDLAYVEKFCKGE